MHWTLSSVLACLPLAGAANASCPPAGFDSISEFDLDSFVAKRWYSQQQMATKYFPKSQNRCIYNDYKYKRSLLGYELQIHSHLEDVDLPHKTHDKAVACLKILDKARGKFRIAPCVVPPAAGAASWIIAYDEAEGYALISGGPPTVASEAGCSTGSGAGLWILTSKQQRDDALVEKVRAIAAQKGFDTSVLNDVIQDDCNSITHVVV